MVFSKSILVQLFTILPTKVCDLTDDQRRTSNLNFAILQSINLVELSLQNIKLVELSLQSLNLGKLLLQNLNLNHLLVNIPLQNNLLNLLSIYLSQNF